MARRYSPCTSRITSRECSSTTTAIQRLSALPSRKLARRARHDRRERELLPPRASAAKAQRKPCHRPGMRRSAGRAARGEEVLAEDSEHPGVAVQVVSRDLAAG